MNIRAKFVCNSVTLNQYEQDVVKLSPVYGPDGTANAAWSKATPSGSLELTITNPEARGQFQPGKSYFLDISPAE